MSAGLDFDTVLAAAVHEIKNMMGELSLNLEDYRTRHSDPETARMAALARLLQNRLVQILILQKAGGGRLTVNTDTLNPAELLDEVADDARLSLPARLTLEARDESGEPFWFIDRYLVAQVLMNALHNAAKFARERVMLVCRAEEGGLVFEVGDDGPGYPDLPGYRAELADEVDRAGTGLGLLFNERIAAALGGRVARRNADGARFTLWLPR